MADLSTHNMLLLIIVSINSLWFAATEPTMKIEVLKDPPSDCKRKAESGDIIAMHYRGTLEKTSKEFDSSYSRNQPFEFKLGAGMVIPGWEQGVPGMCVGEKRKLTIPPSLAYGDTGFGEIIPAKSTLVFEIELMQIKEKAKRTSEEDEEEEDREEEEHEHEHPDSFGALDQDGNKEITVEEMTRYIKAYQDEHDGEDSEDSVETIVSEIFQEDDKNKDGVITFEEYQHSAGMYDEGYEDVKEEL